MLNREALLNAPGPATTIIEVPEWGGQLRIKAFSGTERAEFAKICAADDKIMAEIFGKVLILGCVEENGSPLLGAADVDTIMAKDGRVVQRVAEAIMEFNGLTDKAAETIKGNSAGIQSDGSGSEKAESVG